MRRGEIRWYTYATPDKRRPVLLLTRDEVIDQLNEIIAVPATRTIRGIETEVLLSLEEGMPAEPPSSQAPTSAHDGTWHALMHPTDYTPRFALGTPA